MDTRSRLTAAKESKRKLYREARDLLQSPTTTILCHSAKRRYLQIHQSSWRGRVAITGISVPCPLAPYLPPLLLLLPCGCWSGLGACLRHGATRLSRCRSSAVRADACGVSSCMRKNNNRGGSFSTWLFFPLLMVFQAHLVILQRRGDGLRCDVGRHCHRTGFVAAELQED